MCVVSGPCRSSTILFPDRATFFSALSYSVSGSSSASKVLRSLFIVFFVRHPLHPSLLFICSALQSLKLIFLFLTNHLLLISFYHPLPIISFRYKTRRCLECYHRTAKSIKLNLQRAFFPFRYFPLPHV